MEMSFHGAMVRDIFNSIPPTQNIFERVKTHQNLYSTPQHLEWFQEGNVQTPDP